MKIITLNNYNKCRLWIFFKFKKEWSGGHQSSVWHINFCCCLLWADIHDIDIEIKPEQYIGNDHSTDKPSNGN